MSSMQIDLYDALTGANIPSDKAKAVVESLQEHIDMQVSRANEAVLAKLDGVETGLLAKIEGFQTTLVAKLDAIVSGRIDPIEKAVAQLINDKQLRVQRARWVIGTMIGTVGGGLAVLHAMHVI